jgi:predicted XRE-type DNA-binding protein
MPSRRRATDGLPQTKATAQIGIAQPDLSNILHGKFRGIIVDRLTGMLARLGYGVDIILRAPAASEALRTVHVRP